MFIEQAITRENKFWKYIVGSLVVISATFVGQLPLVAAILAKSMATGGPFPDSNEELMGFLDPNLTLFLILLSFMVALGALYFVVRFLHKQTFLSVTTARSKVDWGRVFFSFGLWTVISVVSTVVAYIIAPEDFVVTFEPVPFMILALIAIVMVPFQTSAEEYIFRGYLMQGFGNLALNKWFPLVMTSVIFGLMHIMNPEVSKIGYIIMVYYIGTGLFLGVMTLMDDGMELALGFHASNNLVGAMLVTADWSAFQTPSILKDVSEPTAGYDVLFPILIVFPILLLIFSKRYKWSGWSEKLTGNIELNKTEPRPDDQSDI